MIPGLFPLSGPANPRYRHRFSRIPVYLRDDALDRRDMVRPGLCTFHPVEYLVPGPVQADLFVHANDAVCHPGHSQVGNVARTLGENAFVRGLYVGMGPGDKACPAIQVEAQGFLLPGGFGMEIDQDNGAPGLIPGGKVCGYTAFGNGVKGFEGAINGGHGFPALEVDHQPGGVVFFGLIPAMSHSSGRIIGGA